jgi:FMN-dependent NADH-azoreductase
MVLTMGSTLVLKLWIDQVVRYGKTFTYENHTPIGLLKDKVATFIVASGGVYDEGSPSSAMNFVDPYLKSLFGYLGVTDTTFIHAGGTMQVLYGVDRETILQPPIATIQAQFQAA